MIEDIQATFRHRFTTTARTRIATAMQAALAADHVALGGAVRELHSLAGEAGLLGFSEVVPIARLGEDRAKHMATARTPNTDLVATLHELSALIEQIAQR